MTSKAIADNAVIVVHIEKNLHIKSLMNIGEVVKLKPLTLQFASLQGKYILKSTDIKFVKDSEWLTTARLEMVRTNKTV